MTLENQVVSLDLSKRLKELGFKQDSLFYYSKPYDIHVYDLFKTIQPYSLKSDTDSPPISAYTVAELGEMLPFSSKSLRQPIYKNCKRTKRHEYICWRGNNYPNYETANTEADARAKMLIYLKENNLI